MSDQDKLPDGSKSNVNNPPNQKLTTAHHRKYAIFVLFLFWLIGYNILLYKRIPIDVKYYYVFIGLIFILLLDILYSMFISDKGSEDFKLFMVQTAVPITALSMVCFLAYHKSIDSTTTISLFGISLGYTTYVVGKPSKRPNESDQTNATK